MPVATATPTASPIARPAKPPIPAPVAEAAPAAPPREGREWHDTGTRIVLHNVSWETYIQLSEAVGEGYPYLTYDDGDLELYMNSQLHEIIRWYFGRFVEVYCEEHAIDYMATGSTTRRREVKRGGLEPDESYYLQNYQRVRKLKEVDLEKYPPPDLAIEIDLSPPGVEKANIYRRLGVPEIWRWRGGRITVLHLVGDEYAQRDTSPALPGFPLDRLAAAIEAFPETAQAEALRDFRRFCREGAQSPA